MSNDATITNALKKQIHMLHITIVLLISINDDDDEFVL